MINEEIRAKELRVIDTDGTQMGIMSRQEALDISEEKKLDLVCISPKANPPVCKILEMTFPTLDTGCTISAVRC